MSPRQFQLWTSGLENIDSSLRLTRLLSYLSTCHMAYSSVPQLPSLQKIHQLWGVKNTITEVWPLIWLCFGPLHKELRTWTTEFEGKKGIFRNPLIILIFYIWKKESPERSRWCAKARKSTVRVWVQYGFPYTAVCLIGNHLLKYGTIHRGALV